MIGKLSDTSFEGMKQNPFKRKKALATIFARAFV